MRKCKCDDVDVMLEEDPSFVITDQSITPFEVLEAGKSFEIPILMYLAPSRKYKLIVTWKDENGEAYKKHVIGTV